jgi:hypothetical protein
MVDVRGGGYEPIEVVDLSDQVWRPVDSAEPSPPVKRRRPQPHQRLPLAVAALLALVLVGDVARIAGHSSGARLSGQAAAARPIATPTPTPTPSITTDPASSPVPAPVSTGDFSYSQVVPFPSVLPTLGLIIPNGPAPVAVANVKTDLTRRMVVLNDDVALPDTVEKGVGFHTLAQDIALLPPARQAVNRTNLTAEGFEGALTNEWVDVESQQAIFVTLQRFATPAGAQTHLAHLSGGPAGSQNRLHLVATKLPHAFAFAGTSAVGDSAERLTYFESGRYFAIVEVAGEPGDKTIASVANQVANAELTNCA